MSKIFLGLGKDKIVSDRNDPFWMKSVHPDDLQRCRETFQAAFQARERFEIEYHLRCADGEYRWILETGIPLFLSEGAFAGYIASCTDATERQQAEEVLRESAEQLRLLSENVADMISRQTPEGIYRAFGFTFILNA